MEEWEEWEELEREWLAIASDWDGEEELRL
jgi:hypothetical protein